MDDRNCADLNVNMNNMSHEHTSTCARNTTRRDVFASRELAHNSRSYPRLRDLWNERLLIGEMVNELNFEIMQNRTMITAHSSSGISRDDSHANSYGNHVLESTT